MQVGRSLSGLYLLQQACSRRSAGSASPLRTVMLSEHSDTTPPGPSHSPSATKEGLPQLPKKKKKRVVLSQLHPEFPLQRKQVNAVWYSHNLSSTPLRFTNIFTHMSIQQFLTWNMTPRFAQPKDSEKIVELLCWSTRFSALPFPSPSTFWKTFQKTSLSHSA